MKRTLALLIFALTIVGPVLAQSAKKTEAAAAKAVTADYSSEALVFELIRSENRFENDGSGSTHYIARCRVQSEAGVKQIANLRFNYEQDLQELTFAYIRARKPDGTVINTPIESVMDMSSDVSRVAPMYSDLREKHVNVINVRPGDIVEYDFTLTHKPLFPGQFTFDQNVVEDNIVLDEQIVLNVPSGRKLNLKVLPKLEATKTEENGRTIYTWKSKNLAVKDATADAKKAPVQRILLLEPSIQASTFDGWNEFGKVLKALFTETAVASPAIKAKVATLTRGLTTDTERAQAIYSFVAQEIRYVGLEFGIGRLRPHAAEAVLTNGYGDCKDKHTLLTAMLQAAGIESYPVLISTKRKLLPDLASPSEFDHVISAITIGKQRILVDTTPEVAPFGMITEQLRGRDALVVLPGGMTEIVKVSDDLPFAQSKSLNITGKTDKAGNFEALVVQTLHGDDELVFRSAFRQTEREKWVDIAQALSFMSGFGGKVKDVNISNLEDTKTPLTITYTYSRENYVTWETDHGSMRVALPDLGLPEVETVDNKVLPVSFRAPIEINTHARITLPEDTTPLLPDDLEFDKPYAAYESSYKASAGAVDIERKLRIKVREVAEKDLADYKEFQKTLRAEYSADLELLSNKSSKRVGELAEPPKLKVRLEQEKAASDLMKQGYEAMQRRDLPTALAKFKETVKLYPQHPDAWAELARVRLMMGEMSEGLQFARKQLEVNPQNREANILIAGALMVQGDTEGAVAAAKRQLKLVPEDIRPRAMIIDYHLRQKEYKEAIPYFEAMAAVGGMDPRLKQSMADTYLKAGMTDKAMPILDELLRDNDTPMYRNNIAYALAEAGLQLDRALSLAQQSATELSASLARTQLDRVTNEKFANTSLLAATWDTIGWIHVKRGNLEKGKPYLESAWATAQSADEAEHLAVLYEKQGNKAKAAEFRTFMSALKNRGPRLIPPSGPVKVTQALSTSKTMETIQELRTIRPARNLKKTLNADMYLLIGPNGVEDVRFINEEQQDLSSTWKEPLMKAKAPGMFPDATPAKLVRRGILSCSEYSNCLVVLLEPQQAHVEQ